MVEPQKPTRGEDDLDEDELLAFVVAEQHASRREEAASGSATMPGALATEALDQAEGGEPL